MTRHLEFVLFGLLALLGHFLLLADWADGGAEAGGAGGTELISLAGATAQIETMVATWTRPPEVQHTVQTDTPDLLAESSPTLTAPLDALPDIAVKLATLTAPTAPRPPVPDMETAPPPPPPVVAEPEKQPEPEKKDPPIPDPRPKAAPAKKAQAASAGVAPQKAAGSGGSSQAGNKGSADVRTASAGQQAKLVSVWGARIRSQVERRKRYPAGSRASGQVVLKLTVQRDGRLAGVSIGRSSGDSRLDAAALSAVKMAGRFPAAPKELPGSVFSFSLPVRFAR